jgi:rubrerythrin
MLAGQGFSKVYQMSGGIKAWKGAKAEGPVELNLDLVRGDETPVEIIKIAYGMEESLGVFYRTVEKKTEDKDLAAITGKLASVEDAHKQELSALYREVESAPLDEKAFEAEVTTTVMEGGYSPEAFLKRNERFLQSPSDVLDLAMMVEAQALDLYLRFSQKSENEQTKATLYRIAEQEKSHLTALGDLRDKRRGE